MNAAHYSPASIKNYERELRFLFSYYHQLSAQELTEEHISKYMLYLRQVQKSGYDKCRMAAHAFAFCWKHVLKLPFILPSKLYPRKQYKLPLVMTVQEVQQLFDAATNHKHRVMLQLIYSTGVRVNEFCHIRIGDVDSKNMRIKIQKGKGNKERFTLLSAALLPELREYYRKFRPVEYLFNGNPKGKPIYPRSVQRIMSETLKKTSLNKEYSLHTLRHSFATHLLEQGASLHTIKELLGHSHLQTTMVYLHLQNHFRQSIVNPLDALMQQNKGS